MNKTPVIFKKITRAHFVLFCTNTPFKPKRVESKKNQYQRQPKHKNKDE